MTMDNLSRDRRRAVEIITALGFGNIERLTIHDGSPSYESAPRIIQMVKLDSSPPACQADSGRTGGALKEEFQRLFEELNRFRDGVIDIEVRHGLPFRLVLEWSASRFASRTLSTQEERG
jgi:hypothetical protein